VKKSVEKVRIKRKKPWIIFRVYANPENLIKKFYKILGNFKNIKTFSKLE
jgi:hypothetical protein